MRSTKRQPFSLWQPKARLRHKTPRRRTRSAWLLVGSTPSSNKKVHNAGSRTQQIIAEGGELGVVGAAATMLQQVVEFADQWFGAILEGGAVDAAAAESMPESEELVSDGQSRFTEGDRRGTAAVNALLEVALDMSPAQLPTGDGQMSVRRPAITDEDAQKGFTHELDEASQTATGNDQVQGDRAGGSRPQPEEHTGQFPACFIHVLDAGLLHGLGGFGMSRSQGRTHFPFEVGHRAQSHGSAKHSRAEFGHTAFADVLAAGQVGDNGDQAWSGRMGADRGGDDGPGDVPTSGTGAPCPWYSVTWMSWGGSSTI